jgi:sporulation protein YlmC with PRC-barrel domain
MTSGKYFNRGVKTLDQPNIGFVVRETPDKIVIFGENNERYDVPDKEIQQVGGNVLLNLKTSELQKYSVPRNAPLPTSRTDPWKDDKIHIDFASYEGKYPNTLFNKGVRAKNEDDVGHVFKETDDMIIIFGRHNKRYDIPKEEIYQVGMNVILKIDFPEIGKYVVNKDNPLPTGEPIHIIHKEAFPEHFND